MGDHFVGATGAGIRRRDDFLAMVFAATGFFAEGLRALALNAAFTGFVDFADFALLRGGDLRLTDAATAFFLALVLVFAAGFARAAGASRDAVLAAGFFAFGFLVGDFGFADFLGDDFLAAGFFRCVVLFRLGVWPSI